MTNNKSIYVLSASAVSPQMSYEQMLQQPAVYLGEKMNCIEPDYTKYIDAKLIRRMSRIIKMGMAASMDCLADAGIQMPDAIITGTAYGCLADTEAFLSRMVEFNETLLSPTAFIQSTHNTVAAQIALQLKCHNYNNTYVHSGASFESALMDSISLINEGEAENVLTGAADEIIEKSHAIISRFGKYKTDGNSTTLFEDGTKGTMAGEGAAFFVLTGTNTTNKAIARLDDMATFSTTEKNSTEIISSFLTKNNVAAKEIDLVLMGISGDKETDAHYETVRQEVFGENKILGFKNYCGEYPTASAFALWMAVKTLQKGKKENDPLLPNRILIYNNYKLQYPTLYLVTAC